MPVWTKQHPAVILHEGRCTVSPRCDWLRDATVHASRRDVDELESLGPRPYSGRGCVPEAHAALVARAAYARRTSDLRKPASARLSRSGTEHVRRALS